MKDFFTRSFLTVGTLILSLLSTQAQTVVIGAGASGGTSSNGATGDPGPMYRSSSSSSFIYSRHHYLYTQSELQAAGLVAGSIITDLAWNKENDGATNSPAAFEIWIKNSALTAVPAAPQPWATLTTGATQVYNAATTVSPAIGWVNFLFTTPFVYTGGALEISVAFDLSSGSSPYTTAGFAWKKDNISDRTISYCGSTSSTTLSNDRTVRPQLQITYTPGTPCTNPVTAGTAESDANVPVCPGAPTMLSLSGHSIGAGITYEWESSPTLSPFVPTSLNTPSLASSLSVNPTSTLYYRCKVICNNGTPEYSTVIQVMVSSGFAGGTYTINSGSPTGGTNFTSFGDAIDAMECGINGPVVLNVVSGSGPYTETLMFGDISGTSATNTIRINGNGETVQFTNTSAERQLLTLDGTKYLTVDSLTFKTLDVDYGWGAWITNGAAYDSIINCHFDMTSITNTSSTESNGIVFSGSSTSATTTGANGSHIYIANNHIQGVAGSGGPYYGISIAGDCDSNLVFNNLIEDFYYYGIRLDDGTSNVIDGNEITRQNKTSTTTMYGIYHTGDSEHTIIRNNRIHTPGGTSGGTSSFYGIALYADPNSSSTKVYNNAVYDINQGGTSRGFYISSADSILLYHNTVAFNQLLSSSSDNQGIYVTGTNDGVIVKNNNVSITGGGTGDKYGFYYSSSGSISEAQHNNFYLNSSQGGSQYYGYYTTDYTTQGAFQTAYPALEVGSPADDPLFMSPGTGNFTPTSLALTAAGEDLTAIVPEDINGLARTTTPTVGAFEAGPPPPDNAAATDLVGPIAFCPGTEDVEIRIANQGSNVISTLEVHWQLDGVPQTPVSITTPLDTFGGTGVFEQNIVLGNHTFTTAPVELKAWTYLPNGVADSDNNNDTIRATLQASMSGIYTINSANPTGGTNYTSFEDFISDLDSFGVCGPVTANVVSGSGPYAEVLTFGDIIGTSATNTIRINGNGETVQYTNTSTERQLLTLNGTKYLTIDSLTFKTLDVDYGWGAWLTNGAAYDSITNCHFDMTSITNTSSTESSGIVFSGSSTSATTTGANGSHIYLANNHIQGVAGSGGPYYGISIAGDCDSNIVENNIVEDFYYYGVRLNEGTGNIIDGNEITRQNKTSTTTMYGIYHTGDSEHTVIRNNRIHTPGGTTGGTSTFYGMALYADPVNSQTLVYNNVIYDINQGGLSRGFYISSADSIKLYHNTVVFDQPISSSSTNYGIYVAGTNDGVEVMNNNVSMTDGGTGTKYGFYYSSTGSITDAQNNNFYVDTAQAGAPNYGYYTTAYTDQAAFQTAYPALEVSSPSVDPMFALIANNDFTPFNPAVISGGMNLNADVPEDINGVTRATSPTIGAFEAEPLEDDDAGVDSLMGPLDSLFCSNEPNQITVRIENYGQNTINNVTIHWMADGVVQTPVTYNSTPLLNAGNPNDNYADVLLGSYVFPYNQPVTFKAWTYEPNGLPDGDVTNDTLVFVIKSAMEGVNVNITPDSALICDGAAVTLDAGNQPPGSLFFWNTGDLTQTTTVNQEGEYYVWAQSIQGCEGTDTIVVGELPSPTANSISILNEGGGTYSFSVIGASFVDSMSWDFGDGSPLVSGAGPHQHTYDTGTYTVRLILFNDCGEFILTRDVEVKSPTGIQDVNKLDQAVTLYPNPTRDQFVLKVDGSVQLLSMEVVNLLGQVVKSQEVLQAGVPYSVSGLASGVYQVVIRTNAGKIVKKLEILR